MRTSEERKLLQLQQKQEQCLSLYLNLISQTKLTSRDFKHMAERIINKPCCQKQKFIDNHILL